jgi:hypothetical protein
MKGLVSFIITNLAVAVLTLSFLAWTVDATILRPEVLIPALEKTGTSKALAGVIPEMITADNPVIDVTPVKDQISRVVTEEYVHGKLAGFITELTSFIKTGQPQPALDLRDLTERLQVASAIMPADVTETLAEPVTFTDPGIISSFSYIRQGYQALELFKVIGPFVGVVLLAILWFLADRGRKASRIAGIFVTLAVWAGIYWALLRFLPRLAEGRLGSAPQAQAAEKVLMAVVNGITGLLSTYFLYFGAACMLAALAFYAAHAVLSRRAARIAASAPPAPIRQLPNKR